MKIAIDGPAGSGKSTVARALAQQLGYTMLDTGAMYRSVTYACMQKGVEVTDEEAVVQVARAARIEFEQNEDGTQRVLLDGEDVSKAIRTPEVDASVSAVSAIPAVREAMVAEQRRLGDEGNVVAEGRDIGTVVFPDAEVKVFLTADAGARAHRRALERNIRDAAQEEEILRDLKARDEADSSRDTAPLRAAEDAHHMDTSSMTVEEEVTAIVELINAVDAGQKKTSDAEPEVATEPVSPAESEAELVDPAADVPAADAEPAAEAAGTATPKTAAKKEKSDEKKTGPMALFEHHEPDEFFEHAIREFPITSRALYGVTIWVCGAISKAFWPWKLENGELLWKAEGGQVVVMNHVSMIDPVIIVISDWFHGRRMRPIYKSEFNKNKLVNWFFARVGAIPVERGTADIKAVRRAQRALQRGEDVLVFPEGTRIYSDDQEVTIHGGFALMAQLAKAPVLPIAIVGARDGAPGGNKPLKPGRIWMRAGEAITFDQIPQMSRKKRAKEMERLAMERVYELRDELRKAHPGKM